MSRLPAAARWCAVIAFLNALTWSFITPPFHVPDEVGHVAYVQHLAETGKVPAKPGAPLYSPELAALMGGIHFEAVIGRPDDRPVLLEAQQREVERLRAEPLSRVGEGGQTVASSQPPLFYALEALVYRASVPSDLLSRLVWMRLLASLFAGLTAMFTVLFLRECFKEPWTWAVGGLAVAFQPLFGFISSGVNPDSLLFAASAATLAGLARAFNRGLDPRLGIGIGTALAVGTLTKQNFLPILPGAMLGLGLLVWRAKGDVRRSSLMGAGAAVGVLAMAVLACVAVNIFALDRTAWGGALAGPASTAAGDLRPGVDPITRSDQINYAWQLYLPRLPFMEDFFPASPLRRTWFDGWIGLYGWLDTAFPPWFYSLAPYVVAPLVALFLAGLVRFRSALRGRASELVCYAAIAGGLLLSIGALGLPYLRDTGDRLEQARYLLPFLPFYGAMLVLAARATGPRLSRPVGAVIVVLAMAHALLSQLLMISRFYG